MESEEFEIFDISRIAGGTKIYKRIPAWNVVYSTLKKWYPCAWY